MTQGLSFFEKLWRSHVVRDYGDGRAIVHIDRHVVHEGSSPEALTSARSRCSQREGTVGTPSTLSARVR